MAASKFILDAAIRFKLKRAPPSESLTDSNSAAVIWAEFKGLDGKPFTSRSGNLVFSLFIDAINPYGKKNAGKHASITFIVLESYNAKLFNVNRTDKSSVQNNKDEDEPVLLFLEYQFGSNTSDTNWEGPDLSALGWEEWTAGSPEDTIFDAAMLRVINSLLPWIHYPTWIKRAIPVLGKASNGKLKADKWGNLFQRQLPLILVKVWYGRIRLEMSLLHNFAHLVSAVNLALKQSMTTEHINF
ncbi:hypothetical protein PCASD_19745 [Puccinia coronata f. sp. avenae]|uniref:Uncharacterized protein n=1 Tax=Puccinia coronata f. sp. avenae TaxID=200324 RepID=A0A2N5TUC5_9BASI|nr:hypothetical protein PCASD_19745 [Puccinia coronata f. sp. avenae]